MHGGKRTSLSHLLPLIALLGMPGCASMKPQLTQDEVTIYSAELGNAAAFQAEPISAAIDVNDAIARAIKYNAGLRVAELEIAVAQADARVQNASLLPNVVADSAYYSHDGRRTGSNAQLNSPGVSNGLNLSWDILDFGLSCVRAGQAADKALYRAEEYRKSALRIAEETRLAYWRAVTLEHLAKRQASIDSDVKAALQAADRAAKDPTMDPVGALSVSRDILTAQREINQLRASLAGSSEQLKQLINVPIGQPVKLKDTRDSSIQKASILAPDEATVAAMENRPEIRQIMYQLRITDDEVNAQILQVLPGIGLQTGLANASLTALTASNWIGWGAKSAWHLMNLLRLPVSMDAIDSQKDLLRQQGLAMAVSISMQVHISSVQVAMQRQALLDSERLLSVQRQLERHEAASVSVGQASVQALTKERITTVLAEARRGIAYADLEGAYGLYLTSLGADLLDMTKIPSASVSELAADLRESARKAPAPHRPVHDLANKRSASGAEKI
jgi:outer membrane protein TolC